MIIFPNCDGLPPRTAVTIGNFDGCHLGHQALVRATIAHGARLDAVPTAVTFRPRPEAFFRGLQDEALLFTEAQKVRALSELGIRCVVVQPFDLPFSKTPHAVYYEQQLKSALGAVALVVGDDFRFGEGRHGDVGFLAERTAADGLAFTTGDAASFAGERISSTRVRTVLSQTGDMAAVSAMLGRPYLLEGVIRRGDQLGRQLGVPTANLEDVGQLLPRFGVYAGWVQLGDAPSVMQRPANAWPAVFSIGIRPTLDVASPPVRVEAHLLAGQWGADELYDQRAGYYLGHWLRGEEAFASLDALKAQMAKDLATARRLVG